MKPQRLILCGWGPYREKQEIDFEKLERRGLFLITGATGAGKTTVFDAITYALYGNMSGSVREKNSVRSDFADTDTPTYVELFMEHAGRQYHIYRNPEYLRPKKRKTGKSEFTTEKEKAILTLAEGEKIEGSSEVTRKIQELLRLDYRQFRQLSMIAQGEFSKLLTASPAEKARIFREIFDTELYDKMASELRARSGRLYKKVMEYRHKLEEDVTLYEPMQEDEDSWSELTRDGYYHFERISEYLKGVYDRQQIRAEEQKQKADLLEAEAEELTAKLTEGKQIQDLTEKLEKERQTEALYAGQRKQKEAEEKRLADALLAKEVHRAEEKWLAMSMLCKEAQEKEALTFQELTLLKEKEVQEKVFYQNAETIQSAFLQKKQKQEIAQNCEEVEKQLRKRREMLQRLQEAYLEAERQEEVLKADYEASDKAYRHGIAGILADGLKEGFPCPVCGSMHHPDRALKDSGMPSKEAVEEKKKAYEQSLEARSEVYAKTAAEKEGADTLFLQLEQEKQKLLEFAEAEKGLDSFVREYLMQHSEGEFGAQKKEYEALLGMIAEKERIYAERKKEKAAYGKEEKELLKAFTEKRRKYFDEEEAYREAFLEEKEAEMLRETILAYQRNVQENRVRIEHLMQELAGRAPMELEALKELVQQKKVQKEEALEEYRRNRQAGNEALRLFRALQEKLDEQMKLEKQYGKIKKLDDAANGNNRLRLVFEQYVLATCFEEILRAANLRLKVMTTGRYELKRMETVGDGRTKDNLEMEVLDYYTGKYRSVKTLSGGESFKVSLCLALGLSDVVQALSGGIRVEALFIDEGFGALDSESLEQACLTLQSLVEKDRLIGIISHVSELSEKIPNQIRVQKTNAGSKISVVSF